MAAMIGAIGGGDFPQGLGHNPIWVGKPRPVNRMARYSTWTETDGVVDGRGDLRVHKRLFRAMNGMKSGRQWVRFRKVVQRYSKEQGNG